MYQNIFDFTFCCNTWPSRFARRVEDGGAIRRIPRHRAGFLNRPTAKSYSPHRSIHPSKRFTPISRCHTCFPRLRPAHAFPLSVRLLFEKLVENTIREIKPQVVMVELDAQRVGSFLEESRKVGGFRSLSVRLSLLCFFFSRCNAVNSPSNTTDCRAGEVRRQTNMHEPPARKRNNAQAAADLFQPTMSFPNSRSSCCAIEGPLLSTKRLGTLLR